ncbi:MAG TPA: NADH-quinone oxidoreductase subunit NuoK [Blastocatellia bacterium]|nr:NADH-quinone oxidoreductase subunit NuoK [Blastocatellia bacterium]
MLLRQPYVNLLIVLAIIAALYYGLPYLYRYLSPKQRRITNAILVLLAIGGLSYAAWRSLQSVDPKRFEPTLINFLMLSFLLFVVGVAGVLSRRNIIIIFMSIELILNAVNLNMIAFSRYLAMNQAALEKAHLVVEPLTGPVFTIFIIVVAAAEAAVGLGIVIAMYRNRETVAIDEIDLLKW